MNRCKLLSLVLSTTLLFALPAVQAQIHAPDGVRTFPADVQRGTMVVQQWPLVQMNGRAERAAPGARITGLNNALLLPGSITGQSVVVNYRRNFQGQLAEIWLLNVAEAKQKIRRSTVLGQPKNAQKPATKGTHYDDMPSYEGVSKDSGFWGQ